MEYKFNTLEEIKTFSEYKELCKRMSRVAKEPTRKNINDLYPLYDWYINACVNCKEIVENFNESYFGNFVNVDDLMIDDKNIF